MSKISSLKLADCMAFLVNYSSGFAIADSLSLIDTLPVVFGLTHVVGMAHRMLDRTPVTLNWITRACLVVPIMH